MKILNTYVIADNSLSKSLPNGKVSLPRKKRFEM